MQRRKFIKNTALLGLSTALVHCRRQITSTKEAFTYQSDYLKIALDKSRLRFNYFSTDSLGKGRFLVNPLFVTDDNVSYHTQSSGDSVAYFTDRKKKIPVWLIEFSGKQIKMRSRFNAGQKAQPFLISFSQKQNHCTALGYFSEDGRLKLPCVLHFPGMGTFRVHCSDAAGCLVYEGQLTDKPFVNIAFPAADEKNPDITYTLESVAIYPDYAPAANNERYDGFKKNFINIFQLSPGFKLLANNTTSDACAFTVFLYAEMARKTPLLAEGLHAFDLVRITLDRYLGGFLGYGMVGKPNWHSKYNSSDSFPSLIMAACYYILETGDLEWAGKNYAGICQWADAMIATDRNGDGIIEYGYSGNAGSWDGDTRPANWWDTIGFGHDDAYSNALAYRACTLLVQVGVHIGEAAGAARYGEFAKRLKASYYNNFYNARTGVLAGWKSADGKLHDYYFVFVNSVAVCYGLIEAQQGKALMTALLDKMNEVGYTNFRLGLPGNLIPVRREDYIHFDRRWGYGKDEEGRDGFQIYENGGATGCYAYFTIRALKLLGMQAQADAILNPMLESFRNGDFEGNCPDSTMTKDWKTWKGDCWGYEGFLVDNYLTLLAVVDG